MGWNETCVMDERVKFITACLCGDESMSEICRQFGVSRKTGYKWLRRYRCEGAGGLDERSCAPLSNPRAIDDELVSACIALRQRYPSWGPKKVRAKLMSEQPDIIWPAASTIGRLFDKVGLTKPRKKRRRVPQQSFPLSHAKSCNDVWCMDFKGWFLTGDGTQVDPFTLTDAASRYLLTCEAVGRCDYNHVCPLLQKAFYDNGLPRALRSDNGPPFAGRGAGALSRLGVQLIKAGVLPERIAPGKPQQNGRHERLHLTLKQETAAPPARSLAEQMKCFAAFQQCYNDERPHEALGQTPPSQHYRSSRRSYDGQARSPDYDEGVVVRKVRQAGDIKWRGRLIYLSETLRGEPVGLHQIDDRTWLVKYGPIALGTLKGEDGFRKHKGWEKSEAAKTPGQERS